VTRCFCTWSLLKILQILYAIRTCNQYWLPSNVFSYLRELAQFLGMWHELIPNRIPTDSRVCRFDHHFMWLTVKVVYLLQAWSSVIFRTVVQCWQNFNWHSASRGPSAVVEFLVFMLIVSMFFDWLLCSVLY